MSIATALCTAVQHLGPSPSSPDLKSFGERCFGALHVVLGRGSALFFFPTERFKMSLPSGLFFSCSDGRATLRKNETFASSRIKSISLSGYLFLGTTFTVASQDAPAAREIGSHSTLSTSHFDFMNLGAFPGQIDADTWRKRSSCSPSEARQRNVVVYRLHKSLKKRKLHRHCH